MGSQRLDLAIGAMAHGVEVQAVAFFQPVGKNHLERNSHAHHPAIRGGGVVDDLGAAVRTQVGVAHGRDEQPLIGGSAGPAGRGVAAGEEEAQKSPT